MTVAGVGGFLKNLAKCVRREDVEDSVIIDRLYELERGNNEFRLLNTFCDAVLQLHHDLTILVATESFAALLGTTCSVEGRNLCEFIATEEDISLCKHVLEFERGGSDTTGFFRCKFLDAFGIPFMADLHFAYSSQRFEILLGVSFSDAEERQDEVRDLPDCPARRFSHNSNGCRRSSAHRRPAPSASSTGVRINRESFCSDFRRSNLPGAVPEETSRQSRAPGTNFSEPSLPSHSPGLATPELASVIPVGGDHPTPLSSQEQGTHLFSLIQGRWFKISGHISGDRCNTMVISGTEMHFQSGGRPLQLQSLSGGISVDQEGHLILQNRNGTLVYSRRDPRGFTRAASSDA
eukprot:TRINITY_DN9698_c0_g1_i1.p1 TRINITY_DN9698_c0_g1~~TRINITY_DN9698_c0_g1_i1.p1  ORF type:complete len:350 (+),score=44.39 TRINITY_DN9698_c0_g1_i1:71-1120(+)